MRSFYTLLTQTAETRAVLMESGSNALSFPHRFRKETFRSKKPSKKARKGTFEGHVVAGTRLELFILTFTKFFSAKIRDILELVREFLELVQDIFGRGQMNDA